MLRNFFEFIDKLNNNLNNKIREISVKQSKITFTFDDSLIFNRADFNLIDRLETDIGISDITTFQDTLFVSFTNLSEEMIPSDYSPDSIFGLYHFIIQLRDIVCTCPALEFVVSDNYLKVYLDLPNLYIKDIAQIDKLLKQEGILELTHQRPYILYVKDW